MIRRLSNFGISFKIAATVFLVVLCVQQIVGPPAVKHARPNHTVPDHPDNQEKPEDDMNTRLDLEYNRYLKEVVDLLESDPEFRKKLETAEEVDFRNGKVASELEYLNHQVRTKLDEVKRTELARLRELMKANEEQKKAKDPEHHGHLDHSNPHTFEVQDFQMLMDKVRKDLEKADEERRQNFKEYEMQKEFEKEQKMKAMDEEHQKAYLKELEEAKKKAQQHDPVHHPGSKAQLEEVWEKADHMMQKFNPKTFFYLHDLDGNGYWDEHEVNALFLKELDKIYALATNNSEVDMREREEEMERMREHVFKEADLNGDRFISYDEFMDQTRKSDWQRDDGWESIDQKPQFTQDEYHEFERRRQAEVEELIRQGLIPNQHEFAHPGGVPQYHPGQGAGVPIHPGQYQAHPGAAQPQYQAHPAVAQQQYQQHPAVAQQQYQQHPAAGQQYQPHPGVAQQQYQQHPAAGQQYQPHPAAAQQQYQPHPAAGQQQYQPAAAQQQHYQQPQHLNAIPHGYPNEVPQYQQQPPQQYQQVPQLNQHPNQVPQANQPASNVNTANQQQNNVPAAGNQAVNVPVQPVHLPPAGNSTHQDVPAVPPVNQVHEQPQQHAQQPAADHPKTNEIPS